MVGCAGVKNTRGVMGGSPVSRARDRQTLPASLTYSGRVSQVGRDLSFNLSYSHNIPGGNKGDQAAFDEPGQRLGASAKYSIWRAGAAFSQLLPSDFLMRAPLNAQHTTHLLIPGEQFGMGGADSVRGYYERETA